MIVATAGHVDHGKTTLVRALTGTDTDRLAEEQRRGLTIELGFAYVDWEDERWGFVDVPGHERFIANMLAGIGSLDLALLVVAADDGVMPQTREHVQALRLLGAPAVVAAISRTDLVDPDRSAEVGAAVVELLATQGYPDAAAVPVSAVSGSGLDALRETLRARAAASRAARPMRSARLAVDRAFAIRGAGTVVTGTLHSGVLTRGDELELQPLDRRVRIRGLHVMDQEADRAEAGQRVAVNLGGVDAADVARGSWLAASGLTRATRRFDAEVEIDAGATLRNGMEVHLHHGTSHGLARLMLLRQDSDGRALVHLASREPVAPLHDDRFVLRDAGARRILGGGRVLDVDPPARRRRHPQRLAWLAALGGERPAGIVRELLELTPLSVDLDALQRRLGVAAATLLEACDDACVLDPTTGALGTLRRRADWEQLKTRIVDAVDRWHRGNPQLGGMKPDQLHAVIESAGAALVDRASAELVREGRLRQSATAVQLPDYAPRLAGSDDRLWQRVEPVLLAAGRKPPVVHDLARELGETPKTIEALFSRATHAGLLVRISDNRYFLPEVVAELAALAEATGRAAEGGLFDARAFRDAAAIGRNAAIDLLEYFDRMGLTRRRGDERLVTGSAREIFGAD